MCENTQSVVHAAFSEGHLSCSSLTCRRRKDGRQRPLLTAQQHSAEKW